MSTYEKYVSKKCLFRTRMLHITKTYLHLSLRGTEQGLRVSTHVIIRSIYEKYVSNTNTNVTNN